MASVDVDTEIVLVARSEQSVVFHRRDRDDGGAQCGATFFEPPEEIEEPEALERGRRECLGCRGDRAKVSRCPWCGERADLRDHLPKCEAAQEATSP